MPNTNRKHPEPIDVAALAALFHVAADPTRARILLFLGDGERHVGALREIVGCSLPVFSNHLTTIRLVGLVEARSDGKRRIYSLTEAGMEMRGAVEALASLPRIRIGAGR
jgi:DNA-binding transcriptional ArsR family regulator